jgi:hypothetical protein
MIQSYEQLEPELSDRRSDKLWQAGLRYRLVVWRTPGVQPSTPDRMQCYYGTDADELEQLAFVKRLSGFKTAWATLSAPVELTV